MPGSGGACSVTSADRFGREAVPGTGVPASIRYSRPRIQQTLDGSCLSVANRHLSHPLDKEVPTMLIPTRVAAIGLGALFALVPMRCPGPTETPPPPTTEAPDPPICDGGDTGYPCGPFGP